MDTTQIYLHANIELKDRAMHLTQVTAAGCMAPWLITQKRCSNSAAPFRTNQPVTRTFLDCDGRTDSDVPLAKVRNTG